MKRLVYIGSLGSSDYREVFRRGLDYIRFQSLVTGDSRVFIKPNLTFPTYREGVMTSPEAVEAAILAIRDYTPHILIGDSDGGGYNRFSMDEVYRATGLWKFAEKHRVRVVNLSQVERKPIAFDRGAKRQLVVDLPRLLTDEIDLLVTMPVPKVHSNTYVSLTFKNQWGCIPEPGERLRLHPHFQHAVTVVNEAVRAKVAMIDGRYGLNINGPLRGKPTRLNWALIADDIGAAARISCNLMQIPVQAIPHLRYASSLGLVPARDEIELNEDIQRFVKERFVLHRAWTDYPGYFTFRSSLLAYIGYFSPLAGLLHRLLYLFREPFYEHDRGSSLVESEGMKMRK